MFRKLTQPPTGAQRSVKGKRSYKLFGRLLVVFVLLATASAFAAGTSAASFSIIGSVSEFFGMAPPATEIVSPALFDGGSPVEANLSQTGAWTERYDSTSYPSGLVASFAKPTGTNRLLVVAIASTRTLAGSQTVSGVTYGGQALTLAAGDASSTVTGNHSYLYYLNDAGITAATGVTPALNVTITGGTSLRNWIHTAAFDGVNQTTPLTDAKNFNSSSTANDNVGPFSPTLTIAAGDQAIQIINLARSAIGDNTRDIDAFATGWASGTGGVDEAHNVDDTLRPHLYIRNRSVTTAASDGSEHSADSDNTHDSMTAMSIKSDITSETFTTTNTWTVPPGVTSVTVQTWGGGGAGGGSTAAGSGTARGGGGGGGGAYASSVVTPVTPGQIYNVTVAATKAGTSGANGANGDPTHFALQSSPVAYIVLAAGGTGGTANTTGGTPAGGAAGTAGASIGTTTTAGTAGGAGDTGTGIESGAGGAGANPSGGAGGPSVTTSGNEAPGNPGTPPGGGGSGSRTSSIADNDPQTGGSGGSGRVVISYTIAAGVAQTATVNNSPQTFTGAGQAATVTCSGGGIATNILTGGAATQTNAATYAVTADCPAMPGFLVGTALPAGNFVINPAAQTATITNTPQIYTGGVLTATVSCTSGAATLAGGGTGTAAGNYPATVNCAATANYLAAAGIAPTNNPFVISPAPQTATITNTPQIYTGGVLTATVSCSGGGAATLATGGTGTNVGNYPATVDCAATPNFTAMVGIAPTNNPFVISPAAPTATITNTPAVFTGGVLTATVSCSGGGAATLASGGTGTNVGNYPATVDCAASANYTAAVGIAPTNNPFVISAATPTAFITNTPATFNFAVQTATVSCSGGGAATLASGGTGTFVGNYPATVDCAASANYNAALGLVPTNGDFVIQRLTPTLNIDPPFTFVFNGTPRGPTAAVTNYELPGLLTFSYYGVGGTTYGPSSTRPTNVGTYEVQVSGPETANFNAFTSGGFAFAITQAAQVITVTTPAPNSAYVGSTFTVAATGGGSIEPVVITVTGDCTGGGNNTAIITMGAAVCTVHYNQAADLNFEVAPEITSNTTSVACPEITTPNLSSRTGPPAPAAGVVPIVIPVNTTALSNTTSPNIFGASFTLTYDAADLQFVGATAGPAAPGAVVTPNGAVPGTLLVTVSGASAFNGSGALVNLDFNVIGPIGGTSPLTVSGFQFNEVLVLPVCNTLGTMGTLTITSGTITGKVLYANAAAPPHPVPGVSITADHTTNADIVATSNATGDYSLTGFLDTNYTVTPSKPKQITITNGFTANDAARISQHVVNIAALVDNQLLAADVTQEGTISALDAAFVAQYIVSIANPANHTGEWKFTPISTTPDETLNSVQNYSAVLLGDVNGSWLNTGTHPRTEVVDDGNAARISIPNAEAQPGSMATVPFRIDNLKEKGVTSYQFDVEYDPAVVTPSEVAADIAGTRSEGLAVVSNVPEPGLLKVVVYGALPATGDGTYLNLRFETIGGIGASTPLTIKELRINDGDPVVSTDGSLTLRASASTGGSIRGRVAASNGQGLRNARVVLTNSRGEQSVFTTSSFGRFEFTGLTVGETYTIAVSSNRYRFAPQIISLSDNLAELEMIAQE